MELGVLNAQGSKRLLRAFKNVTVPGEWASNFTEATRQAKPWRASGAVAREVWLPIASWVKAQLSEVVGKAREGTGCLVMDKRKCRAKGWLVSKYVSVPLGENASGKVVWEYAHRLVAWGREGLVSGEVAMHGAIRPCASMLCARPSHIAWGTASDNAQEWRDRRKR